MDIGEKIKNLRIQKNLTQEELANRCELSKGFISQVENNITSPSIATLIDILETLGTSLQLFFNEKDEEQITFSSNDMFEKDKLLEALNLCLKEYDKSERIVKTIPINECFNLMTDACDNINYVLQKLKYGLTIHGDALLSTIQLMPTVRNEVTSIKDMLNEMIGSKSYEFNKVIAMRKAPQHNYCYEESFIYGKYVFVLKEVICNTPDKHFYVYIRKGFSSEYIIVDDSSIRAASKEQIDISSTALGIYYVFEDENTAKESDIQQDVSEVTINYKDLEISDEIKEILQNIGEDTKSTHQKQNRTTSNETVYCRKDLQSITPIVRIEFPSRKEEQGLVYMKDFIAKFE